MRSLCHTQVMNLTTYDMDYLNVPTYLRRNKPALPTCIHKTIDLDEAADSNLQAISVLNQLDGMKSGEVLKVEGELTDTCTMNIREFTGADVVRCDGVAYVTSAGPRGDDAACLDLAEAMSYLDVPAIVRVSGKRYEML